LGGVWATLMVVERVGKSVMAARRLVSSEAVGTGEGQVGLKDSIILSIVDKGLLALVLAVAGFWLNRYLESFKSRRALENDLRKLRDQKQLELLQAQLCQFYWPIYFGLQMDNAVWEKILQRESDDQLRAAIGKKIESDFIMPNHDAIAKTIMSNIHLAAPGSELMNELLKYLRHIAIYRALRASGNTNIDPIVVGEPWPTKVFPAVEKATLEKQREFDALLFQRKGA
jgi:hypothetical protein